MYFKPELPFYSPFMASIARQECLRVSLELSSTIVYKCSTAAA